MKKGVLKVGPGIKKQTAEGSAAIKEAIEYLENASPTSQQIKFDSVISGPSQVYTQDDAVKTFVAENQLEDVDYFAYSEISKETCFGNFDRPTDIILDLLVDDGNSSRSNRNNLFSDTLTNIGLIFNEEKDKLTIVYFSEEFPTSILEKLSPEADQMEEYVEVQDCRAGVTNKHTDEEAEIKKSRTKKKDKRAKTLGTLAKKVSVIINEVGEQLSKIEFQSSDGKEESEEKEHHHHHHHHDDLSKSSKKHKHRSKSKKKKSHKHHKHHTHHKSEHGKKHVHHTHGDDHQEINRSNSSDRPNQAKHRLSEFVHNHGGDSDEGEVAFPEDSFESDSSSKQGKQPLNSHFCRL
jgi:hypothetical protein